MSAFTFDHILELLPGEDSNFTSLPNRIHIGKLNWFHDTVQHMTTVFRSYTSKQSYKSEHSELQVMSLGIDLPAVKAPGLLRSAM